MKVGPLPMAVAKYHHVGYSIEERIRLLNQVVSNFFADPDKVARLRRVFLPTLARKCGRHWCIRERDFRKEVEHVYNFVRTNVRYSHDVWSIDTFQGPLQTLYLRTGDCDDISVLLVCLLLLIGVEAKWVVIRTKDPVQTGNRVEYLPADDWNHIYVLAGVPKVLPDKKSRVEWIPLDASLPASPGWSVPKQRVVERKIFDLPKDLYPTNEKKLDIME